MRSELVGALAGALLIGSMGASRVCAQQPTTAESAPPVDEATRQHARDLFAEGVQHGQNNMWREALQSFQQAYDLVHEPSILFNLAGAQVEIGLLREGAESYRQFLRDVTSGPAARHRREAQRLLTAVEARLPKVRIQIAGLQDGDQVTIDGTSVTPDGLAEFLEINPGDHTVIVTRGGREWANQQFTIAESARDSIAVTLTEPPTAPTPEQTATAANGPTNEEDAHRRHRRRVIIGSSVAGGVAVVVVAVIVAVVATH